MYCMVMIHDMVPLESSIRHCAERERLATEGARQAMKEETLR